MCLDLCDLTHFSGLCSSLICKMGINICIMCDKRDKEMKSYSSPRPDMGGRGCSAVRVLLGLLQVKPAHHQGGHQRRWVTTAPLRKLSVPLGRPDQEGRECLALAQADCPRRPKGELVNANTAARGRGLCKRFQNNRQRRQEAAQGGHRSVNEAQQCKRGSVRRARGLCAIAFPTRHGPAQQ